MAAFQRGGEDEYEKAGIDRRGVDVDTWCLAEEDGSTDG